MLTTVTGILVLSSFVLCILSAAGKAPLWASVLVLLIAELLHYLPL